MLTITECINCQHTEVCKYKEDFNSEREILLAAKNKFENSDIQVICRNYKMILATPKGVRNE
jgi:hypothetical protein